MISLAKTKAKKSKKDWNKKEKKRKESTGHYWHYSSEKIEQYESQGNIYQLQEDNISEWKLY